jgi:hypothetical protein
MHITIITSRAVQRMGALSQDEQQQRVLQLAATHCQ